MNSWRGGIMTYETLADLKVALDANFNQKVILSFSEDIVNRQSIIKARLEDDFVLEVRTDWDNRYELTENNLFLSLLMAFKSLYNEVY